MNFVFFFLTFNDFCFSVNSFIISGFSFTGTGEAELNHICQPFLSSVKKNGLMRFNFLLKKSYDLSDINRCSTDMLAFLGVAQSYGSVVTAPF